MMNLKNRLILMMFYAVSFAVHGGPLKPIMTIPGEVAVQDDFSKKAPLDKSVWKPHQATRWSVEDGVLRGIESTEETQARKKHHRGLEPRLSCPATPPEFAAEFSVRFSEGEPTVIVPFVEFGHHIARIRFREEGVDLLADHETLQVAAAPEFKWESGRWYVCLAELKGDEFVIQFEDGPTLYARYPGFAEPVSSGGSGLGIAGPRHGIAELDNVTIRTIVGEHPDWPETRAALPVHEAVRIKEKKIKKKKK
jgi:hypothetical protein